MSLISASDYNAIRSKVLTILGPGAGVYGYGINGSLESNPVQENEIVTADHWQRLIRDINTIGLHQTNSLAVTTVSRGQKILQSKFSEISSIVDTFYADHDIVAPEQLTQNIEFAAIGDPANSNIFGQDRRWGKGIGGTEGIIKIDFSSTERARWFFNQGGHYIFQGEFDGAPPSQTSLNDNNEQSWKTALNSHTGFKLSRTEHALIVAGGNTYTEIFRYDFAGPNYILISGKTNDSGKSIEVKFTLEDDRPYQTGFYDGVGYEFSRQTPPNAVNKVGFNIIRYTANNISGPPALTGYIPTATRIQQFTYYGEY